MTSPRRAGSISVRDGHIVLSELTEDEVRAKIDLLRSDLAWLHTDCKLVPSVAKNDPRDAIIQFRNEEGGRFFDDIFASDGSERVLLSDDFHLRQWAEGLFGTKCAWIQALLFHLEAAGRIPIHTTVKGTVQLCQLGQEALSINSERLLAGAEMLKSGEVTDKDFEILCSLLGQPGADMPSHVEVASWTIKGLWMVSDKSHFRERTTSTILRKLIRHQGSSSKIALDAIQALLPDGRIHEYIARWKIGHFIC